MKWIPRKLTAIYFWRLNISIKYDVSVDKIEEVLAGYKIWNPLGRGSLARMSLLQIKKKTDTISLRKVILEDYFEEFTKKHYEK